MYFSIIFIFHSLLFISRSIADPCPVSQFIDGTIFSKDLVKMRKFLGGHADIDILFPFYKEGSLLGNVVIQYQCDLECYDFDSFFTKACRWHNEKNGCDGIHDELDWIRMRGAWGKPGDEVFMKTDRPDGFYLFVGIQTKLPEMYSAMLVSDPIQCQEGDGILKFRFWTSPGVKIRVCTRPPSMGKRYNWCSDPVKRNNTKTANVQIPGSIINMFEIVIEAYSFSLDAFGVQGGAAAIDDISYNSTSIYKCQMLPHIEKLSNVTEKVCRAIYCDFDIGDCIDKLPKRWEITDEAIGPNTSGVSQVLEGSFGYVKGPGDATLSIGELKIPRTYGLQFCYFSASYGTSFRVVEIEEQSRESIVLFEMPKIDQFSKSWLCKRVFLSVNGTIEFQVKNLRNKFSYFGLDQIDLIDPMTSTSACEV